MRVLVTGATGLIGSALCDALLSRGDEVVGLTRDPDRARPKNPTVHWYAWQATAERPPTEALTGLDGVVNLIGEEINQRLTDQAKVRIRESRLVSTRNLLQGIQAAPSKPKVFIGQSAIGYYGDSGAKILDEESPPGDGFTADIPIDWETAERKAEGIVTRVVIFRTGLVISKRGGLLKQLLLPFKLGMGGPIAGGEQFMSWIHIDDEVGLLLWALDNDAGQRNRQRDRAQPGDEPGALQGARPGAAPPRLHADPKVRRQRAAGRRARRRGRRRSPRSAQARTGPGLRVQAPGARRGTALSTALSTAPTTSGRDAPRRARRQSSARSRCAPRDRTGP